MNTAFNLMMKYIRLLGIVIVLFFVNPSSGQIWIEDFDGSNSANPPTINLECGPFGFDYFGIGCCGTGCGPLVVNSTLCSFYQGEDGNFLGAYNTDSGSGCDANEDDETAEWTGINISSCTAPDKLFLCFEVANLVSSINNGSGWDDPSKVTFTVTIDGGVPIELTAIEDQGSNSVPAFDSDCDGVGDGTELNQFMTEFCVQIPGNGGSSLDLLINIDGLNEQIEEIIIDNIAIHCESDDSSLSGEYLGCGDVCADVSPTFAVIPSQCEGGADPLPVTSTEGYTGSWSPVFDPSITSTYTFTPSAGFCLSNATATVTIDQPVISTFGVIPNQCEDEIDPLPASSLEGYTGSWAPSFDPNTTTTYTFTPTAGQCATDGMVTVTIDIPEISNFNIIPNQCEGESDPLPTTSLEGHTGTWTPTFDPNNTTTYTFTPTAGQCVTGGSITVTIDTPALSTFDAVPSQCEGESDPLPAASLEGHTGTWSPVFDPINTTTYTFTPTAGQCVTGATINITIDAPASSTFSTIPNQCEGESDPLPVTSIEGHTGTWSPTFDPNNTTTYTFSPTTGQCAIGGSAIVTIDNLVSSTFNLIPNQCEGEPDPLPATSIEGHTGTWSPTFDPNNTTIYTFTPTTGQCITGGTATVTIDELVPTTFDPIPNQCEGESDPLPTASLEGHTGTWSPVFDPNNTTTYTFTPTTGQCVTGGNATVTIDNLSTSTFDPIPNQCEGESDPLPATSLEGHTGTWSPVFDPNNTTTYTFTPTTGQCVTGGNATVTIDNLSASTFDPIPNQCEGETNPLPATSLEGHTGTWSPVFDPNNTTTYTFTPTTGQCVTGGNATVTIDELVTTTFDPIPNQCEGESDPLPTASLEGHTGTWSPVFDPNNTTTYTFTPTTGQCVTGGNATVTIDNLSTSTFDPIPNQCEGESDPLPANSLEGYTGTWSPVFDPNNTTTYTFTPTTGQCVTGGNATVTIDNLSASTFDPIPNQCEGETNPLPATSLEGHTGTWSPVFDPNNTTTYTFTPTTGQCVTGGNATVTIDELVTTTFDPIPNQCEGESDPLPTASLEGHNGTWSPVFDPNNTTTYTFTPTTGQCATNGTVIVTIDEASLSTFDAIPSQCEGSSDPLPASSLEGFTGSWTPVFDPNNTATYTFIPTAGQCATEGTLTVTIDIAITPTFNAIPSQCAGGDNPLITISTEGINGTWSPIFDPNLTGNYTFNPNPDECANTAILTVTIDQPTNPTFSPIPIQCVDESNPLNNSSLEGIIGSWTPVFDPSSTQTYTFMPMSGLCANTATLTVTIDQLTVPTFSTILDQCAGGTSPLNNVSLESITGTWTPTFQPNVTTNYTFMPDPGQCSDIAMIIITIEQPTIPDFSDPSLHCELDDQVYTLQTTSGNGIQGSWSPSSSYVPSVLPLGISVFTFTPDDDICAEELSIDITVEVGVSPTFTSLGPYCVGDTPDLLQEISLNGIIGTWDGPISTLTPGTTTYTFTPEPTICASKTTMNILIEDCGCTSPATISIVPIGTICEDETVSLNASLGGSASSLTWSSSGDGSFDNNNSLTAIYTPGTTDITNGTVTLTALTNDPDGSGPCLAISDQVILTINSLITPLFTQLGPYCQGNTPDNLPLTSLNGINGNWDGPINSSSPGSFEFNFIPTANQCANSATMSVVIDAPQIATFNEIPTQCSEGLNPLPIESLEGFSGIWGPAFDPNNTTTYVFIVDAGQCAADGSITVSIDQQTQPIFTQLGPYCVDDTPDMFSLISENGINGTWDGPITTTNPGSSIYTFTPSDVECATSAIMQIEVNDCGCMDPALITIDPISSICETETIGLSANISGSANMVTWSSNGDGSFNNTTSSSPIYTPGTNDIANGSVILTATTNDPDGSGPCLESSANVVLMITVEDLPLFTQLGPYCIDDIPEVLPLTSVNGISGTWNAPIITSSPGSSTYTFTPDNNECASITVMQIEVTDCSCMDPAQVSIDPISPICDNESITLNAIISGSASMVTWTSNGDGVYTNTTSNTPAYTPGIVDISNGSVTLTATTDDPDGSGPCVAASFDITLLINAQELPEFNQLGPYCVDDTPDDLPLTSVNGISGTWDGPIITASSGLITYNFTPNSGACAMNTSMGIMVNDCDCMDLAEITIEPISPICENETIILMATLSGSASAVTWSSNGDGAFDNTVAVTPTYTPGLNDISSGSVIITATTDDPDGSGPCLEASADITLMISAQEIPQFTQLGPYCVDDQQDDLPITSMNGINGIWDGPINTSNPGLITYTFIPSNDECAMTTTMEIEVNDCGCANPAQLTIDPISPICENEMTALSANLSGSATMVTWTTNGDGSYDNTTSNTPIYTPGINDIASGSVNLTATTNDPDESGPCLEASSNVILIINSPDLPQFSQLGPYCIDDTPDALPLTSVNGITGTWDAQITTVTSSMITYNFTPDIGECAYSVSMQIVVNDCVCLDLAEIMIDPISTICENETIVLMANLSGAANTVSWATNGDGSYDNSTSITPTYTPGVNDIANGTVNLTATTDDPDGAGPCLEANDNVFLTINNQELPQFSQLGPYCVDDIPDVLPLTSINGISGTWNGDIITTSPGSSTYTFTPISGECALGITIEIEVNDCGCPDPALITIDPILPICENEMIGLFATLAGSASNVTWSSSGDGSYDNTTSNTPTYTPGIIDITNGSVSISATTNDPDGSGPCLEANTDVTLIIISQEAPQFAQLGPYCIDDTPEALPFTSINGVSGTWDSPITTASSGMITYNFTPDIGECATTATMIIEINECGCANPALVTIEAISPICENETILLSANLAGSASTTSWSSNGDGSYDNTTSNTPTYTPGVNDIVNATIILTVITDDPDGPGPCLEGSSDITLLINSFDIPIFTQLGPYCINDSPDDLPITSENGINGTWDGNIITSTSGITSYTFTPDLGECAEVFTTTVTVENCDCGDQTTISLPCDDNNPCTTNDVSIVIAIDSTECVPCIGIETEIEETENDKSISQQISSFDETFTVAASELYSNWTMFDGLLIDDQNLPNGFNAEIDTTTGILTIIYNSGIEGEFDISIEICNDGCLVTCFELALNLDIKSNCFDVESLNFPSGFTPNGDGVNDVFRIAGYSECQSEYQTNELIIWNRWGNEVFSQQPYQNSWNGTDQSGKSLPEGTYYYSAVFDSSNGVISNGYIVILR